jgi:hypothetical protein
LAGESGNRRLVERAERQQVRVARLPAAHQPVQVARVPGSGAGAQGSGQQQRQLARDPAEPVQHQQAGQICPLQVIDGQHDRPGRAPPVDQFQDRLGDQELGVGHGEGAG